MVSLIGVSLTNVQRNQKREIQDKNKKGAECKREKKEEKTPCKPDVGEYI